MPTKYRRNGSLKPFIRNDVIRVVSHNDNNDKNYIIDDVYHLCGAKYENILLVQRYFKTCYFKSSFRIFRTCFTYTLVSNTN